MYFAPHRLYKRTETEERDALNRIISKGEQWDFICECRCDDNTTQKFEGKDGRVYIPKYKIVCPRADIKEGDYVQCRIGDCCCNAKVRGEGRVFNTSMCNYLDYMVAYV